MSQMIYKVLRHDGGWAYEANGTYSERFVSRDAARKAATRAARRQSEPGETVSITFEDEQGRWHKEVDSGTDRPDTRVKG